MPEISRFFGIVVQMYYGDHAPPHFHVRYGRETALVGIRDLVVIGGTLPPRALGLVMEWAVKHREELEANWEKARALQPLLAIDPLE